MRRQSPQVIRRIRQQYDRLTEFHRDADGLLALPTAALLASATVP